jgi:hypothetical protein
LPCQFPPLPTCQEPGAINIGGPLPCQFPPPPVVSTIPSGYTQAPRPADIGVGTLPDNTDRKNPTNVGSILDGTYVIINLNVTVSSTPDNNYDLAFYEWNNGGSVNLDWIIIGISIYSDGHDYYEVFNWGNGTPDTNSNIGDVAQATGTENDNQRINPSELYDPDYDPAPPVTDGPAPQTGILIDVDNATSAPPVDTTYNYVVIISPNGGAVPSEEAQVDAIQAVEVPIP